MLSLAEVQSRLRNAVVSGDVAAVAPLLVGGQDPSWRLGIHRRHYEASLLAAVMGRFPATSWLVGTPWLEAAAADFVRQCPPTAPCIADYGRAFPAFLAARPGREGVAYLESFSEMDWQLGRLSVAVDLPALDVAVLATVSPETLLDVVLTVQPGTYYAEAIWPIDELIGLYLSDAAPEQVTLAESPVRIEARGARGKFRFSRIASGDFRFRLAVSQGTPLGAAAERAASCDLSFDPGRALAALFSEGLVSDMDVTLSGAV